MSKENVLFVIIGLLGGLIIGFVFANSVNQRAVPMAGQAAPSGAMPAGHPEIPGQSAGGNQPEIQAAIDQAKKEPDNSGMETVTINEPIRLNNIYYDFDDDKILPDAEKDLSFLVELMKKYPDMVIELSSHTDAQGNDAYNERLSQRRAQSAKNWMVAHGIKENRIEAVGYGERNILNDCINGIDCTDEQHRVNRRTEFKIISGPTTIEVKKSDLGDQKKKESAPSVFNAPSKGTTPVTDPKIELTFDKLIGIPGSVNKGEKREMGVYFTKSGTTPYWNLLG